MNAIRPRRPALPTFNFVVARWSAARRAARLPAVSSPPSIPRVASLELRPNRFAVRL